MTATAAASNDFGFLLLTVAIPLGAVIATVVAREYLAKGSSRVRGSVAWAIRYMIIKPSSSHALQRARPEPAGSGYIVLAALGAACGAVAHWLAGQEAERRRWHVRGLALACAFAAVMTLAVLDKFVGAW